ncbi:MAG TPA: RsiV family protein [Mycobacterium sp.]|uniref:esterase n=1 Tax=Mycolicibacterium sp. TaxID=2320850 RepID=UPI0025CED6F3|nr:esterase [Mycolicibacterium sp.]HPX35184.1 RsiV family protein [Mycobacterium sp.]HQC75598.1 RsiV family protein [Mycobacterium sp.]
MRSLFLAALLTTGAVLTPAVASAAPNGCAEMGGVVENRGTCRVQAQTPTYTMDVRYPVHYADEQAIIDYLTQTKAGFLNLAQTPGARNLPYEMDVTAQSFRSANTRSAVLKLFQAVGSAHPTTWYKSFNFDEKKGQPVTFDTVFPPGALQQIFPIVQRELETQTGLTGSISPGDGLDPSHYQNFAITDDSVIFFFGRAELLPSYADATTVAIPRNEIPALLI